MLSVLKKNGRLRYGEFAEKEGFKSGMKKWWGDGILITGCAVAPALCWQRLVLSMGDGKFWPPQNPHPLTDHHKIGTNDYFCGTYSCAKFGANPTMGCFWANWWNITIFIYLCIHFYTNSHIGQIRRRIFTVDGSNDVDSRRDVSFGGFVNIVPYFGSEIPPKIQFSRVNRRFQAKRAKYWKFHVIETTSFI